MPIFAARAEGAPPQRGAEDDALELGGVRVEGVAEWRIFWYIVLPLMKPALAAMAVLIFTFIWNDYFWALVLVQGEEARPITLGIQALRGRWTSAWQLISAASLIVALPPVILFFQFH